ncbi:hypothetical protein D9M68_629850 [compost metagenome]
MENSLNSSLRLKYSSKVKVIFSLLKFVLKSAGSTFKTFGGVVSLGPPSGERILAQP